MPLAPPDLGFTGDEERGWSRALRGRPVHFRLLLSLTDLTQAETLQQDVLGVSERDLIPANELIVVPETGGAVIGAFFPEEPERAAGVVLGWGGFIGRPRIVSDFLAVRPDARNLGLAAELKRLQAAIALTRGFEEIVWTVDPLRAANARLNFAKLGATSDVYEIDRYGATFATGLYGGLPTDRLHVRWDITSARVLAILRGDREPQPASGTEPLPLYSPGIPDHRTRVELPADIDALVATRPDEAQAWRLRLREALTHAFAEGLVITGFERGTAQSLPALVLERSRQLPLSQRTGRREREG
jgi:predicted GNAT superfamily acetyltransferase